MQTESRFESPFSSRKGFHILKALANSFINCDAKVLGFVEDGDFASLINYEVDYSAMDIVTARETRQVLALYQKNPCLPLSIDTRAVAVQRFLEAEEQCKATNSIFRNRFESISKGTLDAGLCYQVLRKISDILGDCPEPDELDFGFGPGANVGVTRLTSVRRKLSANPTVTSQATVHLPMLVREFPHWDFLYRFKVVQAGNLDVVPKNAKTGRCIVVEPVVNTFLQKGIGRAIRRRLRLVGVDLKDQSRNRRLAQQASVDGKYATLDLEAASDTISYEVVKEVIPYQWFALLESARTPRVRLHSGRIIDQEKFSSMGNGYTFELESLLFTAVLMTLTRDFSVYGDDLIVPTEFAAEAIRRLNMFGFKVNPKKSFVDGPFRESCGGDFLSGVDIRPCYVKSEVSVKTLFRLHNFFYRHGNWTACALLSSYIPGKMRIYGPDGYGDGHLLGDHHLSRPKWKWAGGYYFKTYAARPDERRETLRGDYAAFLCMQTRQAPTYRRDDGIQWVHDHTGAQASLSIYFERSKRPQYSLIKIYHLG